MILRLLTAAALFLLPFVLFYLWRRAWPRWEVTRWTVGLAAVGVLLALGSLVWYGQSGRMAPDATYVPARMGPDGRVVPPHAGPPAMLLPREDER